MYVHMLKALERDPSIRYSDFGYGTVAEILWPPTPPMSPIGNIPYVSQRFDLDEFGMALMDTTGRKFAFSLLKQVEIGKYVCRHTRREVPLVIERFFRQDENSKLIPYRVSYRGANWSTAEALLYRTAISDLHATFLGGPLDFVPPALGYLWKLHDYGYRDQLDWLFKETAYLDECPAEGSLWFERWNGHEISRGLDPVARAASGQIAEVPGILPEMEIPVVAEQDSLTRNHPSGTIPLADITRMAVSTPAFDTTMPAYIPCHDVTYTTPSFMSAAAALLRELTVTDLDLEYISSLGVHPRLERISLAVDRFAHIAPATLNNKAIADRIADTALRTTLFHEPEFKDRYDRGYPLAIHIVKTFGEEALIEIYPHAEPVHSRPRIATHIDLAMLSLCGPGLSIL